MPARSQRVLTGLQLRVDEAVSHAFIEGTIAVPRGAGMTIDVGVRIEYIGISPFKIPDGFQTDGTFTPEHDRHIRDDGWLCLWLRHAAPMYFAEADGLERYLADLREFLVLQQMYDDRKRRNITPYWPGPQWDHGAAGHRQWIREHIREVKPETLRRLVRFLGRPPKPNALCPCGSQRVFRNCHGPWLSRLCSVTAQEPDAGDELQKILAEPTRADGNSEAQPGDVDQL